MAEVWKDVPGLNGRYQISNLGNLKSVYGYKYNHWDKAIHKTSGERILAPSYIGKSKYFHIRIDGKIKFLSAGMLIAQAFLTGSTEYVDVGYKDGNISNVTLENIYIKSQDSLPGEIWRPISGFEGYYEVSNKYRVRSLSHDTVVKRKFKDGSIKEHTRHRNGRILSPKTLRNGEYYVNLHLSGVSHTKTITQLVEETFGESLKNT